MHSAMVDDGVSSSDDDDDMEEEEEGEGESGWGVMCTQHTRTRARECVYVGGWSIHIRNHAGA